MTRPAPTGALATRAIALLSRLHPTLNLGRQAPREDQAVLPPLNLGPPGPRVLRDPNISGIFDK